MTQHRRTRPSGQDRRPVQQSGRSTGRNTRRRRKKRARLSPAAVLLLVLIAVAGLLITLSLTVFFPVKSFSVSGSDRYSAQQIIDASGINKGSNVLMSGLGAEDRICQRLPYIVEASVSRSLSGNVTIKVKQVKPTGVFEFAGRYFIVGGQKVLEGVDKLPEGLTVINTAVSSAEPGQNIKLSDDISEAYGKLNRAITAVKLTKLTRIDMTSAASIKMIYDNRLILDIGTISDIDKKLQNAVKIIEATQKKYGQKVEGTINLKWLGAGANDSYFSRHSLSEVSSSISTQSGSATMSSDTASSDTSSNEEPSQSSDASSIQSASSQPSE